MPNISQDVANLLRQQAETMNVLIHLDFDRKRVVRAVTSGDLSTLVEN